MDEWFEQDFDKCRSNNKAYKGVTQPKPDSSSEDGFI